MLARRCAMRELLAPLVPGNRAKLLAALYWSKTVERVDVQERLETGIAKTVDWYLANADWLIPVKQLGRLGTRTMELTGAPP